MTLVRAVLSNMVVFWFSLCKFPKFIINKIRIMIMAFIWSGEVKQLKYHRVRWEAISRPVGNGGRGLKDMNLFSLALREKSLWWVITGKGLWSKVIKGKYISRSTTIHWVRNSF